MIRGTSSAFGGDSYHEQGQGQGQGQRWVGGGSEEAHHTQVGLPVEFDNICLAMKYFRGNENLNIRTQVIGVGTGCFLDA